MFEQQVIEWMRRHAQRGQRLGEIRYRWPVKATMASGTAMFAILVVVGIHEKVDTAIVIGLAAFAIVSLAGVAEAFGVKVDYDEHYLYTQSPWRSDRMIEISDVVEVRYTNWAQWFVLETTRNGDVRLHTLLNGNELLFDQLRSRGLSIPQPELY